MTKNMTKNKNTYVVKGFNKFGEEVFYDYDEGYPISSKLTYAKTHSLEEAISWLKNDIGNPFARVDVRDAKIFELISQFKEVTSKELLTYEKSKMELLLEDLSHDQRTLLKEILTAR
jgi:hypothetical protein